MGGSTHGHLSAKYREKGPKDAWAETTRGSSNNSTLFEANAQPKIFQEQPIQCTGETIKRSPATVPIQAASYAIPKPTPKHQPEWSFADPLAASMAASTPSQLLHRTTLQPITFGNFLRNYLAELRAVALQAKLEAGMTPEAIKAEATQHAKDFERGWKQTEIPGFKDMLVMARARYAVKREDAEEEWYQMKQAARLVEGHPDNPKTAQPEQKAASTSKAAQSEWMYINNFDSTSCIQLVHRKTHEPVDHESEHYNIYKEIRDRCDLAKLATGMTLEHLIAEGTQSQLDFNAGKVEAVKERMSTADLIAEKMREKVDAAEKDFWARQAAQN